MKLSACVFVVFVFVLALLELKGYRHPCMWFMVGLWIFATNGFEQKKGA